MQNKVNFMEIWMDVMRETQSENQMDTDFVPLINSHSNLICIDHECGDEMGFGPTVLLLFANSHFALTECWIFMSSRIKKIWE